MNDAQMMFLQQQVGKLKGQPVPVRGVLSRRQRELEAQDTQRHEQMIGEIKTNLVENPALTVQLYNAIGGQAPAFPMSGV